MPFEAQKLRIGVSACLVGQRVRYDGGHKRHPVLADELAAIIEWVPVCPEVEVGMGVPRESVALVRVGSALHMRGVASARDWTDAMAAFVTTRLAALGDLAGYVCKAKSPSCAFGSVPIADEAGQVETSRGTGLFTAGLRARFPNLPIAEESVFDDANARQSFLVRVTAYHRLTKLWSLPWAVGDLEAICRDYDELIAQSPGFAAALGALLASAAALGRAELGDRFECLFLRALETARVATCSP
jgi:uncharacterized protein YbbK (DUF523 family)